MHSSPLPSAWFFWFSDFYNILMIAITYVSSTINNCNSLEVVYK